MALATATKQLFADELLRLAKEKPIAKISVAEVCRGCGSTRQTFYYYFRDKYDLVAWIYLQDFSKSVGSSDAIDDGVLSRTLEVIYERRDFYRNALQDPSQNNLMGYIQEYGAEFILQTLEERYGLKLVHRLRMAVNCHSCGMIELVVDWLNGDVETDAEELAEVLNQSLRGILQSYRE